MDQCKPQAIKGSTRRALLRINGLMCCLKGPGQAHLAPRTNCAEYLSVEVQKDSPVLYASAGGERWAFDWGGLCFNPSTAAS